MSWAVARMALPDLVLPDEIREGDQERERHHKGDHEVRPRVADPADIDDVPLGEEVGTRAAGRRPSTRARCSGAEGEANRRDQRGGRGWLRRGR